MRHHQGLILCLQSLYWKVILPSGFVLPQYVPVKVNASLSCMSTTCINANGVFICMLSSCIPNAARVSTGVLCFLLCVISRYMYPQIYVSTYSLKGILLKESGKATFWNVFSSCHFFLLCDGEVHYNSADGSWVQGSG